MSRFRARVASFLLFFAASGIAPTALASPTALSVQFGLENLLTMVTLCRDPTAVAQFGSDGQWGVFVDVDNDAGTGAPLNGTGMDAILIAVTPFQPQPCTAHDATLATNLKAYVSYWDGNTFVASAQRAWVTLDFNARTLTIASDITGVLSGVTGASKYWAATQAAYMQAPPPNVLNALAMDPAPVLSVHDAAQTRPAGDVGNCNSTCSPAVSWYPMIDLVGIGASIVTGDGIFANDFEASPTATVPGGT